MTRSSRERHQTRKRRRSRVRSWWYRTPDRDKVVAVIGVCVAVASAAVVAWVILFV